MCQIDTLDLALLPCDQFPAEFAQGRRKKCPRSLSVRLVESGFAMPQGIDLSQSHEFLDAAGRVMGYYLPAEEFTASGTQTDIPNGGAALPKPWERICRALTEERDRLRAELEALRAERDQYRQAVFALTRETFTFDKQVLLTPDPTRPTLEQVIDELEPTQGPRHA
jgi:hypothetical protein